MTKILLTTRRYNKETYKFWWNVPNAQGEKGICGIVIDPYITVETPENAFGYSDTVVYDDKKDFSYTLHRYLQPWILKKITEVARKYYRQQ